MGAKCIQPARKAAVVAAFAAVCLLCQPVRAADPAAAEVLSAGGRVSVIRDSIEWALFAGSSVQVGELIVTGEDGFAHLQVADGSSFTVYPDSQVVFRKNPGNLKDLLDLFLGRIKVHIQKLGGGPNQQRVFTPTAVISVRGTVFDVSVDEDETTVVAVDEGLVGVSHRLLPANIEVEVPEGQSLIIYRNAPLAKARVDKSRAVAVADELARTLAYIWNRIGRRAGRRTRRRRAFAWGHPGSRPPAGARQLAAALDWASTTSGYTHCKRHLTWRASPDGPCRHSWRHILHRTPTPRGFLFTCLTRRSRSGL